MRARNEPFGSALREWIFLLNQRRRLRRIASYRHPTDDPSALLEAVRRKVLVFTVTAGRSGTTYLGKLLALLPDTTCLHEPPPNFAFMLRQAQHEPAAARRFLLEYKLPFIAAVPTSRYVEVSHLFGKGFLEPLLALGVVPRVVMLRRHPRLVAASWQTRGIVPGRSKRALKLHVYPADPGVLPYPGWWKATDYQLCFWYALEIERRQHEYGALLDRAGAVSVDVTPDELHDCARFLEAADRLGLLDRGADLEDLARRHRQVSAIDHKPNAGARASSDPAAEEAVWSAIAPHAPWLRAAVEQRYATAGERPREEPWRRAALRPR